MTTSHNVSYDKPKAAVICLGGWAGRHEHVVQLIGETPKRFRIRAIDRTRLAGRLRWIDAGETALVPKHAVRVLDAPPTTDINDD